MFSPKKQPEFTMSAMFDPTKNRLPNLQWIQPEINIGFNIEILVGVPTGNETRNKEW